MDEIRNSLDNIMARYNDSITHSAPKKLVFDRLSMSFNDDSCTGKKRKKHLLAKLKILIKILLNSAKKTTN